MWDATPLAATRIATSSAPSRQSARVRVRSASGPPTWNAPVICVTRKPSTTRCAHANVVGCSGEAAKPSGSRSSSAHANNIAARAPTQWHRPRRGDHSGRGGTGTGRSGAAVRGTRSCQRACVRSRLLTLRRQHDLLALAHAVEVEARIQLLDLIEPALRLFAADLALRDLPHRVARLDHVLARADDLRHRRGTLVRLPA